MSREIGSVTLGITYGIIRLGGNLSQVPETMLSTIIFGDDVVVLSPVYSLYFLIATQIKRFYNYKIKVPGAMHFGISS